MSVLSIVLFGSRARGDQTPDSDTDLLFVTSEPSGRHVSKGSLSISLYARADLEDRARNGDLFLCHVLQEGRPLYDHQGVVPALRDRFRLRSSYATDIERAADLAWFLVRFGPSRPARRLVARRMAWCVRTILIARTAEAGKPVFSIEGLAAAAPDSALVRRLVTGKDQPPAATAFDDLRSFLLELKLGDPCAASEAPVAYQQRFAETANGIGLSLLEKSEKEPLPYP